MKPLALAAALLAAACQGPDADSIEPGMWSSTLSMKAGDEELWSASLDRCVYSDKASELALTSLRTGQLQGCAPTQSSASRGKFSIHARCPARQTIQADVPMMPGWLASTVRLNGRYTGDTLDGELTAHLEDTLEPMTFTGTMRARRTGSC